MYNFGVPSAAQSYFDHVARAGVAFRYTANGPVGLHDRQARSCSRRAAACAGTPDDLETSYVRMFLAFLGITDVQFVYAEGLAVDEASKARAQEADEAIRRLIQAGASRRSGRRGGSSGRAAARGPSAMIGASFSLQSRAPCRTSRFARLPCSITGAPAGKIAVTPTKSLTNQRDLALARRGWPPPATRSCAIRARSRCADLARRT